MREKQCGVKMENLPTELFLARILLALQSTRTKKEILFRFHRCSLSPVHHPPPTVPFVVNREFELQITLAFCVPSLPAGENSKDIVSKLGNENPLKGAQPLCGQQVEKKGDRQKEKGKNKELKQNAKPNYSYRNWENSSLRKVGRLASSGRNLGSLICPFKR